MRLSSCPARPNSQSKQTCAGRKYVTIYASFNILLFCRLLTKDTKVSRTNARYRHKEVCPREMRWFTKLYVGEILSKSEDTNLSFSAPARRKPSCGATVSKKSPSTCIASSTFVFLSLALFKLYRRWVVNSLQAALRRNHALPTRSKQQLPSRYFNRVHSALLAALCYLGSRSYGTFTIRAAHLQQTSGLLHHEVEEASGRQHE